MEAKDIAVRKRTQIARANRTMFLWIAVASALIGVAVVVGIFLFQQLVYNEKVLTAKQTTASNLKANNAAIDQLKQEILVLDTNIDLAKVKANETDKALQVVLDALPYEPNTLALGASLQHKLLIGIPGLQPIESLTILPVATAEDQMAAPPSTTTPVTPTETTASGDNSIEFSFKITGTQPALQQLLSNLERSIRTIKVIKVNFEVQQNGEIMADVTAHAFYEPTRTIELTKKVVPR